MIRLFDHLGRPIGELGRHNLKSANMALEINGEHSLSVTTDVHLDAGTRALLKHGGKWMEFVVDEQEQTHSSGRYAEGRYHFVWTLQGDLQGVRDGGVMQPGMAFPVGASPALSAALSGTRRWRPGRTDVTTKTGALMAFDSAWDRLNTVVKYWGGNVDAEIVVGDNGVTDRRVLLLQHQGSKIATQHRLEWRHNLTSITRTPDPGPYFCRVIPYGTGEQEYADDGETTFEWPLLITEAGHPRIWLSNPTAEELFKVPDGYGGYEYPTTSVSYSTDDPYELLQLAWADYRYHTLPGIGYSATVSQFAEAGMDVDGIQLGDEVLIDDYGFSEALPLAQQERVLRMEIDLLGKSDIKLTIGRLRQTLERTMSNMAQAVGTQLIAMQAPEYVKPSYAISVPEHPTYTIEDPETGESYVAPATYDALTYNDDGIYGEMEQMDLRTDDLESVVDAVTEVITTDPVTGATVTPSIAVGGTSVGGSGGDGWVHMIDGTVKSTGTVDFVTKHGSGSSSGAGSSSGSSTTPVSSESDAASWGVAKDGARKLLEATAATIRIGNRAAGRVFSQATSDLVDKWGASGTAGSDVIWGGGN